MRKLDRHTDSESDQRLFREWKSSPAIKEIGFRQYAESIQRRPQREYVIIRTFSAGVHAGNILWRKGRELELTNARRIWEWSGANTLTEVARLGIDTNSSKVSIPAPSIILTEAIEIIACSDEGEASIRGASWEK